MMRRARSFILACALVLSTQGGAMADPELTFETWCIGRFSVDVPTGFDAIENYGTFNAMTVETLGAGTQESLTDLVRKRADALSAGQVTVEDVPLLFRGQYRDNELLVLAHELELGQQAGTSFTWTEEAYVLRDGQMMRVVQVLSEDEEDGPRAQMVELARKITPRSRQGVPKTAGSCLPQALAALPATTEVHGMTFAPGDADGAPVGLEITLLSRSPEDPPLDPDMPKGSAPQDITIAGLDGLLVAEPERFGPSRLAVAFRAAEGDTPALRVQVYYYDDRTEPGAEPYTEEYAQQVWNRALSSLRAVSAP